MEPVVNRSMGRRMDNRGTVERERIMSTVMKTFAEIFPAVHVLSERGEGLMPQSRQRKD